MVVQSLNLPSVLVLPQEEVAISVLAVEEVTAVEADLAAVTEGVVMVAATGEVALAAIEGADSVVVDEVISVAASAEEVLAAVAAGSPLVMVISTANATVVMVQEEVEVEVEVDHLEGMADPAEVAAIGMFLTIHFSVFLLEFWGTTSAFTITFALTSASQMMSS